MKKCLKVNKVVRFKNTLEILRKEIQTFLSMLNTKRFPTLLLFQKKMQNKHLSEVADTGWGEGGKMAMST